MIHPTKTLRELRVSAGTPEKRTLYRNARIHPAGGALLVAGEAIAWLGAEDAAPEADRVVDLGGALVTPAFVDAHLHATGAGLALGGLDLSDTRSLAAALDEVAAHARKSPGAVVLGTGWDETRWPERRAPSADELDRAADAAPVYLARADVHSAAVSRSLLAACPEAVGEPGYDPNGHVRLDAHHTVRATAYAAVTADQRTEAQRRTLRHAAGLGIGCVHEMAGPRVSSEADLAGLLALAAREPTPDVVGYWAALGDTETPLRLGVGAGGDLFCDGALGSHTAAVRAPYADRPDTSGHLYHDAGAIADHLIACTEAGLQAGFHAIGDRALDAVAGGLEGAAAVVGRDRLAAARHRVEHAEMPDRRAIATFARHGVIASVQPAFDATWGGADGMYAARLGPERAAGLNPLAAYLAAGVPLVFGSDAPVTRIDPWGGVWAAVHHRTPGSGIPVAAAFAAATGGVLAAGEPATFAAWDCGEFPDGTTPTCLCTVVRGVTIHGGD